MINSFAPAIVRHDVQILKPVEEAVKDTTPLAKRREEQALWAANWQISGEYLRSSKDSFKRIRIADRPDFPLATYQHKPIRCWLEESRLLDLQGIVPFCNLSIENLCDYFIGPPTEQEMQAAERDWQMSSPSDLDAFWAYYRLEGRLKFFQDPTAQIFLDFLQKSKMEIVDFAQNLLAQKSIYFKQNNQSYVFRLKTNYEAESCEQYHYLVVATKTLGYDFVLDLKERDKYACIYNGIWEIRQFDAKKFEFAVIEPSSDDIIIHNLAKNNDGEWIQEPCKPSRVCRIYD